MRFVGALVVVATLAGCSAEDAPAETGSSEDALTGSSAYEKVVEAARFRSGHLACGTTLVLEATAAPRGRYDFLFRPCDDVGGDTRSRGSFEVKSGWFDGLVTSPTLVLTPDPAIEDQDSEPWSYEIKVEDSVYLENEGGDALVPEGSLD